jgi:hypothetical protein
MANGRYNKKGSQESDPEAFEIRIEQYGETVRLRHRPRSDEIWPGLRTSQKLFAVL